jgi:hypothetical protein
MAKRPTLTDVSGFTGATAVNANSNNIETAFDNTLSLDGSVPNAMGADLDMNSNDILNVGEITTSTLSVGGTVVVPSTATTFTDPALTGTPTAPTATGGTNTTQVATTEFVTTAVAGVGGASLFTTVTDYTSSGRVLGTAYTNSTGSPIMVIVTLRVTSLEKFFQISADSFSTNIEIGYVPGAQTHANFAFIIPNGISYRANGNGSPVLQRWVEIS